MKISTIIFLASILSFTILYGQNPLPELRAYQYNTDNNNVDIEKEYNKKFQPVQVTNVYFKYFKNPLYNITFSKDKIMLFRVQYEFMQQTIVKTNNDLLFEFSFDKSNDKLSKVKLTRYRMEKGKVDTEKLSKGDFETIYKENSLVVKITSSSLKAKDVLRVYCSIESSEINLKDLALLNEIDSANHYISFNNPSIFKYNIENTSLDLLKKEETDMNLIKFTYDVSRLTENSTVISTTFRWQVKSGLERNKILFPLLSINLPSDIGISAQEIINKGK